MGVLRWGEIMQNNPTRIIYHHSELSSPHDIEDVRLWHTAPKLKNEEKKIPGKIYGNGWDDVGYHWFIGKNGLLQKGRGELIAGAHCYGYNRSSIGICLEGNMDVEEWTKEQMLIFLRLSKDLFGRYPITIEKVGGHREYGSPKTCPGTKIDCERVRNLLRLYMYLN